jgi:hypothetical protein
LGQVSTLINLHDPLVEKMLAVLEGEEQYRALAAVDRLRAIANAYFTERSGHLVSFLATSPVSGLESPSIASGSPPPPDSQ